MAQPSTRIKVFDELTPRQQRSTIVGILVFVAIVMSVVNGLANGTADWAGLTDNLATQLLGAALTFFMVDLFQEQRSTLQYKTLLIREMRIKDNATAQNAVEELRTHGWLEDGSLQEVYLVSANLKEVDLEDANLARANLEDANLAGAAVWFANLEGARLTDANLEGANVQMTRLQGAYLMGANLEGANLEDANLQEADLLGVNLKGADLEHANLRGAKLLNAKFEGANLEDANLEEASVQYDYSEETPDLTELRVSIGLAVADLDANFNENTTLPDGSKYDPDKGLEQLKRFTDPDHPDFWRSEDQYSPAYRGKRRQAPT